MRSDHPRRNLRSAGIAVALSFAVGVAAAAVDAAAPAATTVATGERFDVLEIRVLGNSVLEPVAIERAIYPFVGPGRSMADLEAARTALATAYADSGYGTVLVDVPEQTIDDGVVRLQVTEGRVDRVRVTGARYFPNAGLRGEIPTARPGAVPNLRELQAELREAGRRSRDRQVTPLLRAGRTPGTVDVELKVKDELPLHGSVEVNDRYTADTSRTRVDVNLSYDNLFRRYHSLSLQFQTAPEEPSEARVFAATYVAPVTPRDLLAVYAVDTNSDVATVGTLSVLGRGQIYGARWIHLLPDRERYFHNLTLGVDFKDFAESILLEDTDPQDTPISYLNWSIAYAGTLLGRSSRTSFTAGANFGLRGLGNGSSEFAFKRYSGKPNVGRPNYVYLRASLEHQHELPLGLRAVARLGGQLAGDPLISNEQLSIGGADSVRGYLESEQLGDYGASGTLELHSPSLLPRAWDGAELRLFAFGDAGIVSLLKPLPGQRRSVDLASAGVGLRFSGYGLSASLDWARAMRSGTRTNDGDDRFHFLLRYGF